MAEFSIKPASSMDELSIKALLGVCQLPFEDVQPAHLIHFLVVYEQVDLVGVVGLEPCDTFGLLRSLAVKQTRREKGLGQHLVARIEDYARQHGLQALYLLTTTAKDFFSKLGYQTVDRASAPAISNQPQNFRAFVQQAQFAC